MKCFIAVLCLVLSACGGGGSDEPAQPASKPAPEVSVKPADQNCLLYSPDGSVCAINPYIASQGRVLPGDGRWDTTKLRQLDAAMKVGGKGPNDHTFGICFEGGSITVGEHGWPDIGATYAGQVYLDFLRRYPNAKFDMHNDAVSGTSSAQAADRVDAFLTRFHCDIMVVEFAVNDNAICLTAPKGTVETGYDRLLTKIQSRGIVPIVFETMLPTGSNAQNCHLYVALNHRVAMFVSMQNAVLPLVNAGIIQKPWFDYDGTHPNAWGHRELSSVLNWNLANI